MSSNNSSPQMKYRFEALIAAMPRIYSLVLRSLASPSPQKLVFIDTIRRGDVVFDVGANRGIFTSYFSNLVGPQGKVYAFEPSQKTCEMLRASLLARTVHDNVVLSCCAIGDTRGYAILQTPSGDDGQASLIKHNHSSWSGAPSVVTEPCDIVTLDDYVEERRLRRLDFVKIDVEGAEGLVIKGFSKGLARFKPILTLELCPCWLDDFGYKPTELLTMLQDLGYDHFDKIEETGRLIDIGNFEGLDESHQSIDIVCSISSEHYSRLSHSRPARGDGLHRNRRPIK